MNSNTHPANLRYEYQKASLDESAVLKDPFKQFEKWFTEAIAAEVDAPEAMALATADKSGQPNVRMVLLKAYGPDGFVFYTNYNSPKASQLLENPKAALLFWWPDLERQIRITGTVKNATEEEADTYFATRPKSAQIGAWSSPQSQVIPDRNFLEQRIGENQQRFGESTVPRPPHWGGFRLTPSSFEFWQGRESRLHDRIRFLKKDSGWAIERLAP